MKEIERIMKLLTNEHNYKKKLEIFSQIQGFYFDNTPTIYSTIENKTGDENIFESILSVDLRPSTKEERIVYNIFIQSCFNKKYCIGDSFTKAYTGFDFSKENQRLHKTLINAIDGKNLLEHLIFKIEERFNYPAILKAKENDNRVVKEIDAQLLSLGKFPNLFAKMVLGIEIDLNQIQLNEFALFNYTHISQIVKFYRFIKQPLQKVIDSFESTFKKIKSNNEQSINSVDEFAKWLNDIDNDDYEQLITGFENLEKYINKNVHEDVKADKERLQQINRNLTNWQYQIKSSFIEPIRETIFYNSKILSEKRTEAINKLLHKIEMALNIIKLRLEGKTQSTRNAKLSNNLSAPIVALFCQLVNQSSLISKMEDESVECYCKRICMKFGLRYTDRVRQSFSNSENKKNKDKIRELILPKVDQRANEMINQYLNKQTK